MSERIRLLGRLAIRGELKVRTGLAIGGGDAGAALVGGEPPVARDLLSGEPYVPGSSLKGKLRALTERALGVTLVPVSTSARGRDARLLHRCASEGEYRSAGLLEGYAGCPVCHLFGTVPQEFRTLPTRLLTRDAPLTEASRLALSRRRTELPFTEVKSEAVLDRLTAAATPRQRERVPAGAAFDARWDLNLYQLGDADLGDARLLGLLFAGLRLLEEDYLGGQGSRGYGRVELAGLQVEVRHDGGLPGETRELAEKLAAAGTVAAALQVTGDPLARAAG